MPESNPTSSIESSTTNQSSLIPNAPLPREAWQRLVDARAALPSDELLAVNLDVQAAAITALGAYDEIVALRAQAIAELPDFDPRAIDELPLYASAAYHAQTLYQIADADAQDLPTLYEEANTLRDMLHTDLAPLVKRGIAPANRLKEYKGSKGYRIVAADLAMLVSTLRACWSTANGKTTSTEADLDRAERLGQRILLAVGRREQAPATASASALDRQRAFTLFVRRYDAVRRVVSYLRWRENDADRIAPSLYAGKTRGPKPDDAPPAVTPTAPAASSIPPSDAPSIATDLNPFAS